MISNLIASRPPIRDLGLGMFSYVQLCYHLGRNAAIAQPVACVISESATEEIQEIPLNVPSAEE